MNVHVLALKVWFSPTEMSGLWSRLKHAMSKVKSPASKAKLEEHKKALRPMNTSCEHRSSFSGRSGTRLPFRSAKFALRGIVE